MSQGTESVVGGRVLVIGYGNLLRGDDGAGPHVANAVARWNRADVDVVAVQQLTPELADGLANARLALFVDAYPAGPADRLKIETLEPADCASPLGHTGNPQELLGLARAVYGSHPPARWIMVPGKNFALGEALSSQAANGIEEALHEIAALLAKEGNGRG